MLFCRLHADINTCLIVKKKKIINENTISGLRAIYLLFVNYASVILIITLVLKQRSPAAALYTRINLGIMTHLEKSQTFISLKKAV